MPSVSLIAWLDHSEAARRRMLEVIDLFREKDTVDELGLGTVRDALADRFFPGTSTIMTRVRYFLLVPWIYRALEEKRVPADRFAQRSRKEELDLVEVIKASADREGNIGQRAGRALKRLPSDVYWAGLAAWGLRLFRGSRREYFDSLPARYQRAEHHRSRREARDDEHDDLHRGAWHVGLPQPPDGFPDVCSLALRAEDAAYLHERIITAAGTRGSLLAELARRRAPHDDAAFVWLHSQVETLPAEHRADLAHARCFSEIMHGAALLYNLMLAERCGSGFTDAAGGYRADMERWAAVLAARTEAFAAWDRAAFWRLVERVNPRLSPRTKAYCDEWWDLCRAGVKGLADAPAARRAVEQREVQLKGPLARLTNAGARERWSGASGAAQLDFRWGIARRLLDDIEAGFAAEEKA